MLHGIKRVVALAAVVASVVTANAQVLVDFQVAQPPPVPRNAETCTIEVFQHTFGNSYNQPAIANYTPPSGCGAAGSWAGITLNFTVTSNGTQYDRLGVFTFQHVEIWRTSTPEPTYDGIIWTYIKDVTRYTPLFAEPGTFIVELDNLLETGLNGEYASTLTATFYASSPENPSVAQANTIIPISTLSNTLANDASVPPSFSLNVTVPQNAVQIYAELYASGNSEEEFWYFNVPTEYLSDLPAGFTYGYGPFREVRLLVDGQLAGVAFPYAVIFTGGILPSAWQPITSYGALDLPTYFVDLTPFVPILADGAPHNITLDVAGSDPDHGINGNWYVSGNLQVVTDPSGKPTTGRITSYSAEPYAVTNSSIVVEGSNVTITVTASRTLSIEAEVTTGSGATTFVSWSQSLEYSNTQYYLDNYLIQNVAQTASGTFLSTHNGTPALVDDFSYPLDINITALNSDSSTFTANFDHSYIRNSLPAPFLLGSTINERQLAGGIFVETADGNYGNGTSNNTFTYLDTKGNTYDREVDAAYENITYDHQGGSLYDGNAFTFPLFSLPAPTIAAPRMPGARRTGL